MSKFKGGDNDDGAENANGFVHHGRKKKKRGKMGRKIKGRK